MENIREKMHTLMVSTPSGFATVNKPLTLSDEDNKWVISTEDHSTILHLPKEDFMQIEQPHTTRIEFHARERGTEYILFKES